jgi:dipeptidyl aminopeptidase/acylaminoacyl peptidase
VRPSDIETLTVPRTLTLRGGVLLAGLSRPDLKTNTYRGHLRKVGLDGTEGPWTQGERDSAPSLSPDGRWVAFLRSGEGEGPVAKPQLHVMPVAGGESKRLTESPLGVGAPSWAPDSRRIAFTARIPEAGRYGAPDADGEPVEGAAEAPRRITRLDYRIDDIGFLGDRPQHLFALDAVAALDADELPELTPLTDGTDVENPVWTPDGKTVIVGAGRDWGRNETEQSDLYAIPAAGGEPRLLVRSAGSVYRWAVSEDGVLWFIGAEFPDGSQEARNAGLWSAVLSELSEGDGPLKTRRLTEIESVDCDSGAGAPVPFGDEILVAVRNRGAVELRAVPRDADLAPLDSLRRLAGERAAVHAFAAEGTTVAAVIATPQSAGEVVLLADGIERILTDYSEALRDKGIRPVEELNTKSADGYPVHGWLVPPEGEGPHPVLLVVHGGPFSAQDWGLFDEAQVYASAGYAVILGNPRGSAGYGESHGRAIVRGFGTVDVDDVLALLDVALTRPDLDTDRVGVMGGSYGGFMTSWLASHHGERFRAAWSERAVNAWDSMAGSSDIGYMFVDGYIGSDLAEQRRASPLTYAEKIDIPFAVVHSEQDWRCPLEQAQRMFVALKRGGADAELLLFPGEGHELSRSGRPRHRVQRFDAILDWWSRHL